MKRILIPTQVYDVHSLAIHRILTQYGIDVIRWFRTDHPSKQNQTFELRNGCIDFTVEDEHSSFSLRDIDLVWYRRPRGSKVVLPETHPDFEYLQLENQHFSQTAWELINPSAIWINHYIDVIRASNKFKQLEVALNSGLHVPTTLSTNDVERIKTFIDEHASSTIIYKSFSGLKEWEEDGTVYRQNAAIVTSSSLPSDLMLRNSSGIYQVAIEKAYELRVLYLGGQFITCKISKSNHEYGSNDWRAIPKSELIIEPYTLPDEVQANISKFMKSLNLLTGSLDFIVDTEGNYIFLEVNESGQFIWMELENPEIKVLQPFCHFLANTLLNCSIDFPTDISALDVLEESEFERLFEQDKERHLVA